MAGRPSQNASRLQPSKRALMPRRPIAEQFDDVVDVPWRLAPDVSPQRGRRRCWSSAGKGTCEQGAPPRGDVRLHLLGPDGEQLGALQKLVGVAETLLLGGALIGDAGISGGDLSSGGGPS